jgi:ABC-type branched-subunit amino acid transport system ATPase component
MSILEVSDIHAGYGQFLVLKGVDLEIDEGQIVCVIGPNGAGKSTLFKTIFGLLNPSQGSVRFRDEDITGMSQRELLNRGIAYVLQRNAVFPDMTVEDNLEMGAFTAGGDYDMDAKVEEMYDIFPVLEEKRKQKASTLSGGQQQMVEFARGLMLDPELLLLDEPTAGLAPKIIDDVFAKVRQINDLGVTILMIEQNIKTGLNYADHAYVLENGQTKFDGPADTILDRPEIREAYLKEEVD